MAEAAAGRMASAEAALRELPGVLDASRFVCVGDTISTDHDATFLRGHGTHLVDERLVATVSGVIERVNKLISVRPLNTRYNPEAGDVVVGRVTEVAQKRWLLDINSRQEAQLMLASVNLPGGIQASRRRTNVDELNMRTLYAENELISAEVQSVMADGGVQLHTRSLKYGKLERGQLVRVPPSLVKRLKQHFHYLEPCDVDAIFGVNGFIWICEHRDPAAQPSDDNNINAEEGIPLPVRQRICRVANAVRVLSSLFFSIQPASVIRTYEASLKSGVASKDMLGSDFLARVMEGEAERRLQEDQDMLS
eukprot:jgi/Chlat1/715/Chrsp104S01205